MNEGSIYLDGRYLHSHPTWDEEDSAWKAHEIADLLGRWGITPRHVCEVGCGAGGVLASLAAALGSGVQFEGYEISPQAIALSAAKESRNVHFSLADAFEDERRHFDVVLAIDVVEHVDDYLQFLRRLRGRGVYKILHIPLDMSVQKVARKGALLRGRNVYGHIHCFTKELALAALDECGYSVLEASFTTWSLDLPKPGVKAGVFRLARRAAFTISPEYAVRILGGFSLLVLAR